MPNGYLDAEVYVGAFTHLDFENYTKIELGYLLIPIPDEKYKALPEVYGRVCSVIYFASKIGVEPDRHCVKKDALTEAMRRAALCEFISIGEYIDVVHPSHKGIWFNEHKESDPILHMLKILRNYNVHIDSSRFSRSKINVSTFFDGEEEHEIEIDLISNLNREGFSKVKSAKNYVTVIDKMIDAFEEQQRMYGIKTLLMKCVLDNLRNLDVLLNADSECDANCES